MLSENFSRFPVKSVYFAVRVTADRSHIKTANQLVLGRLLCRKWQPVKKLRTVRARKVRRDFPSEDRKKEPLRNAFFKFVNRLRPVWRLGFLLIAQLNKNLLQGH